MLFVLFSACILTLVSSSERVLVLLDHYSYTHTHHAFFRNLREAGYDLDIQLSDSSKLGLQKYNEYLYENIIIFAPRTDEFGGMVNSNILAKFVDSGRNIILALGNSNGEAIREFAAECGIRVGSSNSAILDGLQSRQNDTIELTNENSIYADVMTGKVKKILYKGGSVHFDRRNQLLIPVLSATSSSYLEESNLDKNIVGRNLALVVALQAKNNARVTVLGSSDVFSNDLMFPHNEEVDNEQFANNLINWTFQRQGFLRISETHHHLVNETDSQDFYTIRQHLHFGMKIEEFNNGKWIPFCVDDIQLEFVRIDPFVRQYLKCQDGKYNIEFQIPDVHGVYKFLVNYNRPGYSRVDVSISIPIHPLRHNQYERFITSALPYYATCLSMAIGVFLLSFVVLYHDDASVRTKKD